MRNFLLSILLILPLLSLPKSYAEERLLRADRIDLFFGPNSNFDNGNHDNFYKRKQFRWVYREIIPLTVGGFNYFAIIGSIGDKYPNYYGGIQFFKDFSYGNGKASIFSAWDPTNIWCESCSRESQNVPIEKQVDLRLKGTRTVVKPFGNEGTGINTMIHGYEWETNEKIGMLINMKSFDKGTLVTAAIRSDNQPWALMASLYLPAKYSYGLNGNYSFLEDFENPGTENNSIARSYLVGPTYLEDDRGFGLYLNYVRAYASNTTDKLNPLPKRHVVKVEGKWLRVESGIKGRKNARSVYDLILKKPINFPDISAGKNLINQAISNLSSPNQN